MTLYEIRAKLKEQDNSSMMKAREKIAALAAKQNAQRSEMERKEAGLAKQHQYSFPKQS